MLETVLQQYGAFCLIPLLACSGDLMLTLPDIEASAVLVLFEHSDSSIEGYANNLGDDSKPLFLADIPEPVSLSAVFFSQRLERIGVARGEVKNVPDGRPISVLPLFKSFHASAIDPIDWSESDGPNIDRFRVPRFPPEDCAENNGCYNGDQHLCIIPCPLVLEVEPPRFLEMPDAPIWSPCPTGWRPVTKSTEGLVGPPRPIELCEPIVTTLTCNEGEDGFLGDTECRVSAPCETWPTDLPPGRPVLYVQPNATGSGTQNDPYGTVSEALAAAPAQAIIALSIGVHQGSVALRDGITLFGACTQSTILQASDPAVTIPRGESGHLQDLSIDTERAALYSEGETTINNVRIFSQPAAESTTSAIIVDGGTLTASEVTIEGGGRGGIIAFRSRVTLSDVNAFDLAGIGVAILDSSTATISDLWLRHTKAEENRGGLEAKRSTVTLQRIYTSGQHECSVRIEESEATIDTVVAMITRSRQEFLGIGLFAITSTLTGSRVWIQQSSGVGAAIDHGRGSLSDFVLLDTQLFSEQADGLRATGGALELERAFIAGHGHNGLKLDRAHVTLNQVAILDTWSIDGGHTRGIDGRTGSQLEGAGLLLESHEGPGIFWLGSPDLGINLTDVRARFNIGHAVEILNGGVHRIERIDISQGNDSALSIETDGCSLTLRDAYLHDQGSSGLEVKTEATLNAQRFRISDNAGVGLSISRWATLEVSEGELMNNVGGGARVPERFDASLLLNLIRFGPGQTIERAP